LKESRSLQGPGFIGVIEMRLAIVANRIPLFVDDSGRVVVLGISGPLVFEVDLLGIPNDDGAFMSKSDIARPERSDAGASMLKEWCYVL
jgi:hypothetical protein